MKNPNCALGRALKTALALALATPLLASAESQLVNGAGSATAHLDFRIVIPRVLFLAVGTGSTGLVSDPTVDTVVFDYSSNPTAVGTGAPAGSITGNAVPVRVFGNNGAIGLTATTAGALTNGAAGDTITWGQITALSSDPANLPSPVIVDGATGASSSVTVSSGTKVTNRTATWTFSYANTVDAPAGTYGTAPGTNGRVTYTASMP